MICLFFIFALQLVQGCYSEHYNTVIAVTNSTDSVEEDCFNGSHHNYTIDKLPTLNISNGTLFRFCSTLVRLKNNILYSNVNNIGFVGFKFTKLACSIDSDIGIELSNINNIAIHNIAIESCGRNARVDSYHKHNIKAGLIISYSAYISLRNVVIAKNSGTGLALFYNSGLIDINNCTLEGNGVDGKTGGNGVYVETGPSVYNVSDIPANYSFVNCYFLNNSAATGKDSTIQGFSRFDKGGGMCMYVRGSENVDISISESLFKGNQAEKYGGGLFIAYNGKCTNNTVTVMNTRLESNTAKYGGGVYSGYLHSRNPVYNTPQNSWCMFSDVTFSDNCAEYGGGFSLFSTKTPNSDSSNNVRLENCTWINNKGQYGAAVAILPNAWNIVAIGYLPIPVFVSSTFTKNAVINKTLSNNTSQYYEEYSRGLGTFYCLKHRISFEASAHFKKNSGSAIVLDSCIATFNKNSYTCFENNTGFQGGAIHILSSVMYLEERSTLLFHGNKAEDKGGAIYEHISSALIHHYSLTCFIDYIGNSNLTVKDRNITVSFVNNSATQYGHSIFASSLKPCFNRFNSFRLNISNVSEIFETIGDFTYFSTGRQFELATTANHSKIINESSWSDYLSFIPGKEQELPLISVDDFGEEIQTNCIVSIQNRGNSSIESSDYYSSIFTNSTTISLLGKESDEATFTLSDVSPRQNAISFKVTMLPCPPGFLMNYSSLNCKCSLDTNKSYIGLDSCDLTLLQACSKEGYWFGYKENESENENSLISGRCPRGFCQSGKQKLSETANRDELNHIMCSDSRTGTLCGRCVNDSVVYYHSILRFRCGPDNLCHLGWLFYILSEIVPVTFLFLVIIFMNMSYTSGLLNGFIFYCQVIEIVRLLSRDLIHTSDSIKTIDSIYSFIYSMFSLDFFIHESMSYCLWKTNRALDIIVFKCVTILYSFLLVVFVAFVLEKCMSMNCFKFTRFKKHLHFHGKIIHGLSAFLILCYAQCARTFVLLLSFVTIHNKGSTDTSTIVYYDGVIEWLSIEHLPYALPAFVLGVCVLIIPPIILIIYPLHNKVLSLLRLSEIKCVQSFFRPLDKQKPFFDSFQGCFKDEFRFFSGLYLIYRFLIMFNIAYNHVHDSLFYFEMQLLLMMVVHAICQPYKQRLHNIIDTLLFGNLVVIIAITYYNLSYSVTPFETTINTTGLSVIDSILIILPIVVAVCALIYVLIRKCWKKRRSHSGEVEVVEFNDDEFPDRGGLYESYEEHL